MIVFYDLILLSMSLSVTSPDNVLSEIQTHNYFMLSQGDGNQLPVK
jgi:hypothetical protein